MLAFIFFASASLFGFKLALKASPYILLLSLAFPIWAITNTPLREMATTVTTLLLTLLDIPHVREGFTIHLQYGIIEVAHGCSGQNYLVAGMVISIFYSLA